MNAILAKSVCRKWIENACEVRSIEFDEVAFEDAVKGGLAETTWPGRSQVYKSERFTNLTWHLDGAHTDESMQACIEWFRGQTDIEELYVLRRCVVTCRPSSNVLIFNVIKGRDGISLLKQLYDMHQSKPFDTVYFCTNESFKVTESDELIDKTSEVEENLETQRQFQAQWYEWTSSDRAYVFKSVEECVEHIQSSVNCNILVTGSLHLVGNVLKFLDAPVV
jgi:folylpolyglutamate synthase